MDPTDIILNLPLAVPPPGVKQNFVNPKTQGPRVIITAAIMTVIMTIFISVRFYTKIFIKRKFTLDDAACLLSFLFAIIYTATTLALLGHVLGPHQWDIRLRQLTQNSLRVALTLTLIYPLAFLFTKLCLLLLYLQVFRPDKRLKKYIYFGIIFVSLFYSTIFFATLYYVIPRPGVDLLTNAASPQYLTSAKVGIAASAISIITDFYIFCLPVLGVYKLQMPWHRKLGLGALFGVGLLGCVASILATYYRIKYRPSIEKDVTWTTCYVVMTSTVEVDVGIICACSPAFATYYRTKLSKFIDLGSAGSKLKSFSRRVLGSLTRLSPSRGSKSDNNFNMVGARHSRPSDFSEEERFQLKTLPLTRTSQERLADANQPVKRVEMFLTPRARYEGGFTTEEEQHGVAEARL